MLGGVTLLGEAPLGLVGRDAELRVVDAAVRALADRVGSAIAIVGQAGVGKSRLAREAGMLADGQGLVVLTGRAVATGGSTPYRPLIEALAPWARSHSRDDVDLGAHARALEVLVPGWASGPPDPMSPVFIAEALLRVLPSVSGDEPVVLLVEDLHWADEETIASIEYIADAAESLPLLVVVTARDDEGPICRRVIRALAARGTARLVSLNPLDVNSTRELAAMRLGKPVASTLATLLVERAEGLPLFVEELLVALDATGALATSADAQTVDVRPGAVGVLPDTVADTVSARLEALPDEHRIVVETAALLGRSFDHNLLAAVHDDAVAPALQAATTLGLVHEDPDRAGQLRFRHALLRDGVVASTFPPRRAQLARRLLDLLTGHELSDDELAVAVDLAVRAGDNELAARLARRRAMDAFELWAMGTAERGLAEARGYAGADPDLLIEIDVDALRVASIVGRLPVVLQIGQALLTRLDPRGGRHDEQLLETHLRLAQTLLDEDRWQEAQPHLETAAELIDAGDECHVTRLELWSSVLDRQRGDVPTARKRAATAADLARPYDYQTDLVCCALLYEGRAWLPDDVETARARWQESLDYADAHGVRLWRARLLLELAMLEADELRRLASEVDLTLKEADALAREFGGVFTQARVALTQARLHLLRGDIDEAWDALTRAADYGIAGGAPRRAHADLHPAVAAVRGETATEVTPAGAVLIALLADDVDGARTAAAGVDRSVGRGPLSLFVDLVDAQGTTSFGAVVDANALLPDVAAAVERLDAAPFVAALFTRLNASGAAEERDALHAAVATFDRLGLTRSADACRAMLRAAGVPVPRRASAQDGVPEDLKAAGVTARELEVLRLIAEGRTNRDVAETLYLSPRTVEKHVERLLLKTGAANRTALAALAPRD